MTLVKKNNQPAGTKERNSNIELLRIVVMLFVIILHYNNKNNGKAFVYTEALTMHYQVLVCFEMLAICAVDVFVMISGYFMCNSRKADVTKVLQLYGDVIFLAAFRYVLLCVVTTTTFSMSTMLQQMIPLSWYVAVYSALYLISPYLNKVIRGFTAAQFRVMLLILLAVFSVWPSALELITALTGFKLTSLSPMGTQGSGAGYTIVNFVLMYFLGAYLQIHGNQCENGKTIWKSLLAYGVCTVLLVLYSRIYFSGALSYCNPLVIAQSIALFKVFQSMKIKSKAINAAASCSFGVYLLHIRFFKYFHIERYVTGNIWQIPLHVVGTAVAIYIGAAITYWCYQKTLGFVINRCIRKITCLKYEVT